MATDKKRVRPMLWSSVLFFAGLSLFPFLVMVSTTLKTPAEFAEPVHWIPRVIDWSSVVELMQEPNLPSYLRNSLIIAVGTTLIVMVCAIPAAFVLARREFGGRRILLDLILIAQMFAPVVLIVPLFRLFRTVGLLGSLTGVIIATAAFILPFCTWLLVGYFRSVPRDIEEAGKIDGLTDFAIMTRLILPLVGPGLLTTAVYAFFAGWNEFIFAITFLPGTPDLQPISVGVFASVGRFATDWQQLMMMAILGTLPVLVAFGAVQAKLDEGLSSLMGTTEQLGEP